MRRALAGLPHTAQFRPWIPGRQAPAPSRLLLMGTASSEGLENGLRGDLQPFSSPTRQAHLWS